MKEKQKSASSGLSGTSGSRTAVIHQAALGCLTREFTSLEAELIEPRLLGHGRGWK